VTEDIDDAAAATELRHLRAAAAMLLVHWYIAPAASPHADTHTHVLR